MGCHPGPVPDGAHGAAGEHQRDSGITREDGEDGADHDANHHEPDVEGVPGVCHGGEGIWLRGREAGLLPSCKHPGIRVMIMASRSSSRPGNGYEFIDLFAGIGGFHEALSNLGALCVFASELDESARKTYRLNHGRTSPEIFEDDVYFNKDITSITQGVEGDKKSAKLQKYIREHIPKFDLLCAGFPCQPFSQAGHKRGFEDERGNLFFDIEKILYARKPAAVFLENVRHLQSHKGPDGKSTIEEIKTRLSDAGYGDVLVYPVRASEHGLPQHRPRVFIIGFHDDFAEAREQFKPPPARKTFDRTLGDILGGTVYMPDGKTERTIGFTLRVGGKQSPIDDRRNWDGYLVQLRGKQTPSVIRLTPEQGLAMQGFPTGKGLPEDVRAFKFPDDVSYADRMKQLGNSVAVPAIQDYAASIFKALKSVHAQRRDFKK